MITNYFISHLTNRTKNREKVSSLFLIIQLYVSSIILVELSIIMSSHSLLTVLFFLHNFYYSVIMMLFIIVLDLYIFPESLTRSLWFLTFLYFHVICTSIYCCGEKTEKMLHRNSSPKIWSENRRVREWLLFNANSTNFSYIVARTS